MSCSGQGACGTRGGPIKLKISIDHQLSVAVVERRYIFTRGK